MTQTQKIFFFAFRISVGWLFFYAGITKILDPNWSAAGYLNNAKTFTPFYQWLASPAMIGITNFLNEWGLTLIGAALILGLATKPAAYMGAAFMLLYYFPILDFPHPNSHSYIVDEHIIYAAALLAAGSVRFGETWRLNPLGKLGIMRRYPWLAK